MKAVSTDETREAQIRAAKREGRTGPIIAHLEELRRRPHWRISKAKHTNGMRTLTVTGGSGSIVQD